jgi:hypothetical protein
MQSAILEAEWEFSNLDVEDEDACLITPLSAARWLDTRRVGAACSADHQAHMELVDAWLLIECGTELKKQLPAMPKDVRRHDNQPVAGWG